MPRKSDLKCYFGCIIDDFPGGFEEIPKLNNIATPLKHSPIQPTTHPAYYPPKAKSENQAKGKRKSLRIVCVRNSKPATRESSRNKKYLSDAVEGAIPYIKTETPSANSPNPGEQDGEDNEPQDADQNASPEPPTSSPPTPRSSTPQSDPNRRISPVSPKKKYRRDRNKGAGEMFGEYTKSKMRKKIDDEESTNITANKMFLLSLLPAMNCMTPTQIRSFKRVVIELKDRLLNLPSDR